MYGDTRDQMHPKLAMAISATPEASAVLTGDYTTAMAFGGLVTKLVEQGDVEATSMDEVRSGVTRIVGIDEEEFDERMASKDLIDQSTAVQWIRFYDKRQEAQLRADKELQTATYLDDLLTNQVGGEHLDKIQPRIQALEDTIAELETQLDHFSKEDLTIRAIRADMLLRRHIPSLEALRASPYAVSLPDLVDILKQDDLLKAHGETFASSVIGRFADWLHEVGLLPRAWWMRELYSGQTEGLNNNSLAQMHNIWLCQPDVAQLAREYVGDYFSIFPDESPGYVEISSLRNPLKEALVITRAERAAFFEAFPLANGVPNI